MSTLGVMRRPAGSGPDMHRSSRMPIRADVLPRDLLLLDVFAFMTAPDPSKSDLTPPPLSGQQPPTARPPRGSAPAPPPLPSSSQAPTAAEIEGIESARSGSAPPVPPSAGPGRWKNAAPPAPERPRDESDAEELPLEDLAWHERLYRYVMETAPSSAVSFVFHLVILVILALLTIPRANVEAVLLVLDPTMATEEGLDDDDFQQNMTELQLETPEISFDELPVEDPLAAMPEIDLQISPLAAATTLDAKSIGAALTGREAGNKEALLAKYGGTKTTEAAVAAALEWLARQQRQDGTWSLTGPYSNGGVIDNRTAATAMALLAFQGAGTTPKIGKYKRNVARGASALIKMQRSDGFFYQGNQTHQQLYAHAQAMIAICELYGMTKDDRFRKPAEKAIAFSVKHQAPEGGWRYQLGRDSDVSVTGWFLMGLQSARMAGLDVPQETLYRIGAFLDTVQTADGSQYRYRKGEGGPRPAMSAEGLLCRQYLGWAQDDPRLVKGVQRLLERPIDFRQMDVYYWYYATQVCHHQEGEAWERWNAVMREAVPKAQVKVGRERGSWDPRSDAWGSLGGRLYTTCLATYMLEVYYRHLPIYSYRKGNKKD